MECKAGQCKTSTPKGIFIVTPLLEGWPTKAKEAPSLHWSRWTPTQYFNVLGNRNFSHFEIRNLQNLEKNVDVN